jgi:hypothetical protein
MLGGDENTLTCVGTRPTVGASAVAVSPKGVGQTYVINSVTPMREDCSNAELWSATATTLDPYTVSPRGGNGWMLLGSVMTSRARLLVDLNADTLREIGSEVVVAFDRDGDDRADFAITADKCDREIECVLFRVGPPWKTIRKMQLMCSQ